MKWLALLLLSIFATFLEGNAAGCTGKYLRLTGSTGTITDGDGPYDNNAKCEWQIETSSNNVIFLTVKNLMTECGWDYLEVYDGSNANAKRVRAYCGNRNEWKSDVVVTSGSSMYLLFVSDGAVQADGFTLSYSTGACPPACYGTIGQTTGCFEQLCRCQSIGNSVACVPDVGLRARAGHTTNYYMPNNLIYVVGGSDFQDFYLQDTAMYSINTGTWTYFDGDTSALPGVSRHATALVGYKLYLYGGQTKKGVNNNLYMLNPAVGWSKVKTIGAEPPAVFGHSFSYSERQDIILLFGGYSPTIGYSSRVYSFSLYYNRWSRMKTYGYEPGMMYGHAAVFHEPSQLLYVHGGLRDLGRGSYVTQDLIVLDAKVRRWQYVVQSPIARMHHSMTYVGSYLVLHGGYVPQYTGLDTNNPCYYDEFWFYEILCGTWSKVDAMSSDKTLAIPHLMGHGLIFAPTKPILGSNTTFNTSGSFFLVGGFNGKFYDDAISVSITLPRPDFSCAVNFCKPYFRCTECDYKGYCSWCIDQDRVTCLPAPAIATNNTCSVFQMCDTSEIGCQGAKSCIDCNAFDGCLWCDSLSSCLQTSITGALNCGITDGRSCSKETCEAQNSCSDCNLKYVNNTACEWCGGNKVCSLSSVMTTCSEPKTKEDPTKCQIPCSQYDSASTCHQSHRCMWCPSSSTCLNSDTYITIFPFGECITWDLYDEIFLDQTYERYLPSGDYNEFEIYIEDGANDIYVLVESTITLDVSVKCLSTQGYWKAHSSKLVIPAAYRRPGFYIISLSNHAQGTAKYELRVELKPPTPDTSVTTDTLKSFNVIYFVSFFFLFLFSFLFIAILIKKLRDVVIYNRMRNEYLRAKAMRVIPPKFSVNILENGKLRVLTRFTPAVPVAVEYIHGKEVRIAAVTFVCVTPTIKVAKNEEKKKAQSSKSRKPKKEKMLQTLQSLSIQDTPENIAENLKNSEILAKSLEGEEQIQEKGLLQEGRLEEKEENTGLNEHQEIIQIEEDNGEETEGEVEEKDPEEDYFHNLCFATTLARMPGHRMPGEDNCDLSKNDTEGFRDEKSDLNEEETQEQALHSTTTSRNRLLRLIRPGTRYQRLGNTNDELEIEMERRGVDEDDVVSFPDDLSNRLESEYLNPTQNA